MYEVHSYRDKDNATIICGVVLGKYSFVGAGSVVTKDVPDYTLVYGTPAKQAGWICKCGEKLDNDLFCASCRIQYYQHDNGLFEK